MQGLKALILFAVVVAAATGATAQTTGTAAYGLTAGAGYSASAAGTYVITYTNVGVAGAVLTITVDGATQIRLGLIVSSAASLAAGFQSQALAVDVGAGYSLQLSNSAVASSISLTTSTTGAAFQALLTSSTKAACLRLDASANVIAAVPATYSTTTNKLTLTLPAVGNYLVVSQTLSVSLAAGATATYYAGVTGQTFAWASGVAIAFSASASASITTTYSTTHTAGTDAAANFQTKLGAYAVVTVTGATTYDATLSYTYTQAQLTSAGIADASTLHWAKYDTASASWIVPSTGGSVDISARVVAQSTATFSEWGVYAGNSASALAVSATALLVSMLASYTSASTALWN